MVSESGSTHSSYQRGIDFPDSIKAGSGGILQQQSSPGSHKTSFDRGRRPSLSQIATMQKQQTIDDEDFDSTRKFSGSSYQDTLGLFSGLRQDYAWCAGRGYF